MGLEVEAIYEDGQLQLLTPVNLQEGEKVRVNIIRKQEQVQTDLNLFLEGNPNDNLPHNLEPQAREFHPIAVNWGEGPTASEIIMGYCHHQTSD